MTPSVLTWHCTQHGEVNNKFCFDCWAKMNESYRKANNIMARSRPECKDEHFVKKNYASK